MKRCRALALLALLLIWVSIPITVSAEESSTVIGEDYVLEPGEIMDQDLVIVGGTATFAEGSMMAGDVAVMGGELIVESQVHGDIVAFGGSLYLGSGAQVSGNVISFGEFKQHPEAFVSGNVVEGAAVGGGLWSKLADILDANPDLIVPDDIQQDWSITPRTPAQRAASAAKSFGSALLKIMVFSGLAMLLVHFMPKRLGNVNAVMLESAPISVGVGLLTYIAAVLVSIVLVVICIGIPVAAVLWIALALLNVAGWIAAGVIVGEQAVRITKLKLESALWIAALGTTLITIVQYVPCLGWLFGLVLSCWSLGAIILSRLGSTLDTTWAPVVGPATANANAAPIDADRTPPVTTQAGPVETGRSTQADPLDDPLADLGLPLEPELDDLDIDLDLDDDADDAEGDPRGTRKLN